MNIQISSAGGRKVEDILRENGIEDALIAKVDNTLRELYYRLPDDDVHQIVPLDCADGEGSKVYEASLRYLVGMAAAKALPNLRVRISYGISKSMLLTFIDKETNRRIIATADTRNRLESAMREIVAKDLPIVKRTVTKAKALEYYRSIGAQDRIDALSYRPEDTVHLYSCDGYVDYPYSYMVGRMGLLNRFRLLSMNPGLLLSYPRAEDGGEIPPLDTDPSFAKALKRNREWADQVGLESIADINRVYQTYGATDLVGMCEAYCSEQYLKLGDMYRARADKCRLILISGPSSSSKTTFAKRLKTLLMSYGVHPIRISMDDYYIDRCKLPVGPDGKVDLETISALDLPLFNQHMLSLSAGEPTEVPAFDFTLQKRVKGRLLKPEPGAPIIVEGIHALNPQITDSLPRELWLGVYISPQVQVCIDDHNPMSLTDVRLIRRIVRDNRTRNTSAEKTIMTWADVRKGEYENIYPFQENADFVFNSYLSYEMCALKRHALPLLTYVSSTSPAFVTANRLIKFLKYFPSIPEEVIPCNSLIREFIGGSSYE